MTELEQYIHSYFSEAEDDISQIAALFKPALLKKGGFYLKSGYSCDKLSFIRSGFLRIYVSLEDKEVTQWIGSQGSFITDLDSLTFETPARWNIQALTDTELYTIRKEDYKRIAERVIKWPEIEKHFIVKCFTIMENRIFAHLSMPAEERYAVFFKQNTELFNQVPLQYIASMLGMTPETLSRIRKKTALINFLIFCQVGCLFLHLFLPRNIGSAMKNFIKLEALGLMVFFSFLYFHDYNGSWVMYLSLFFVPDVTFLFYLISSKVGGFFLQYITSPRSAGPISSARILLE